MFLISTKKSLLKRQVPLRVGFVLCFPWRLLRNKDTDKAYARYLTQQAFFLRTGMVDI